MSSEKVSSEKTTVTQRAAAKSLKELGPQLERIYDHGPWPDKAEDALYTHLREASNLSQIKQAVALFLKRFKNACGKKPGSKSPRGRKGVGAKRRGKDLEVGSSAADRHHERPVSRVLPIFPRASGPADDAHGS